MTQRRAWDDGISWHTELVTAPSDEALTVALAQRFLRDPNGEAENSLFAIWCAAARRLCERRTQRAIGRQSWVLSLSAFPWGAIRIPKPPLVEVTGITYTDAAGDEATLAASPAEFQTVLPAGPSAQPATVYTLVNESWPTPMEQPDAVRVAFTCGYTAPGSGDASAETDVPDDIMAGLLLVVGELYKQRSESFTDAARTVTPAVLRAYDLWDGYRVHAL